MVRRHFFRTRSDGSVDHLSGCRPGLVVFVVFGLITAGLALAFAYPPSGNAHAVHA